MLSRHQLEGHWDELKSTLQKRWGHLTDDELQQVRGDGKLLVASLERRTGLSRREIEDFLSEVVGGSDSAVTQAADTVRRMTDDAVETARRGYENAGEHIGRRPAGSVGIAFAAGLLTGVVLSLVFARDRR